MKCIYVGRIDSNKNIPRTQQALKILEEKGYDVEFTIIGKVQNEKEFKKIKKDSNTKYLLHGKRNIYKMKRQFTEWETIFSNHIYDKGLIPKIINN